MKNRNKKADLILLVVFLCVFGIALLLSVFHFRKPGQIVQVTVENKLYGEYDLQINQKIEIESTYGRNTLVIENGEACISYADCANHLCMKQGKISRSGESLVCLPHKVIVEIKEK